jgi:hypothetical protein
MEKEREYLSILDLLFRVVQANDGVEQRNEKLLEAEGLARKLFFHSASAFYLARGTTINDFPSTQVSFFDPASIDVLARAIVESFLTFHYIFGSNISDEERDFRFYSWQLGGLKERQKPLSNIQILEQEAKKRLATDQKCIERYEQILKNNKVFLNLKKEQQKNILKGHWRTQYWRDIALDAKLSQTHAEDFYKYLCGYAHSSSLSILQLSQANTRETQLALFAGTMGVIKIAMSNFIFEYCKLFPKSVLELNKNAKAKMAAEDWVRVGQEV